MGLLHRLDHETNPQLTTLRCWRRLCSSAVGCRGGRRWRSAGGQWRPGSAELLGLADQLAEPVDGALVGAQIPAVQGGLRLTERLGLLGQDAGKGGPTRLAPATRARRGPAGWGLAEDLRERALQGGGVAEVAVQEGRDSAQLGDGALAGLDEDRLHVEQRVP